MKIESFSQDKLPAIYKYNELIFPSKVIPAEDYVRFWLTKNDDEYEKSLVVVDDDKSVHGQVFASSMSYYYKGEKTESVWLFDLIVDEELRKDAWGMDVIIECFNKHPQSFSTGSNDTALPLHKKLGNRVLGDIRKYVGIPHPLWLLTSVFRGKASVNSFPKLVHVEGYTYKKTGKRELPDLNKPYNNNLWEPARDKPYLEWRFFSDLHNYAFYKDNKSDDYFVLRTIVQHHVTAMLLVDYRCDASDKNSFERLYKAVSIVMDKLRLGILITGSTLATFDNVLESYHMRPIGRPRPVIGLLKVKERKADIQARNFAFVTLADSDGETNWE